MVQKAGRTDPERGVWGMQLCRGDQLRTKENSQVSILFQNSNLVTLGPNSSLTIADNTPGGSRNSVRKVNPDLTPNLSLLTFHESRDGEAEALAGLRAGKTETDITPMSPRNSKMRSSRPSFEWVSARSHESYGVTLFADTGAVWTCRTGTTRLDYPGSERALEPGKSYFWYVEGEDLFEKTKSPDAGFTLLSSEDVKCVEEQERHLRQTMGGDGENSSVQFLLGAYYDQMGLVMEAIPQFRLLAEKNPDAPLPHEILGRLYEKAGLKDQAIRELQKAVMLGKILQ
jgi:tetratricopeptide (TPR) repeat protein